VSLWGRTCHPTGELLAYDAVRYDVAVVYLEQSGFDVEAAAKAYDEDEAWERANPMRRRRP
jgi:hypothetical protein